MRVLMLAQFYPPVLGGEERHVASLSEELVKRGHRVAVATLQQPGLNEEELVGGVQIHRLPSTLQRAGFLYRDPERRHASPFPDPETTLALRRLVRQFEPDIVHAHNWLVYSYLPLKRWAGVPLVLTLHDYSLVCAIKRLMYKDQQPCNGPAFSKCLACSREHYGPTGPPTYLANSLMGSIERRLVDHYITVSQATARGNGLLPGSGIQYQVIPNFLPDDFDAQKEDIHSLTQQLPEDGYLLYVGDLSRDKGVHVLLEAYAMLAEAPPLVLIGRKTETTPERLPENVIVFNSWPHKAVLEAWERCSIAFAPSVWPEPFGIVVIEAMSASRPVIASDIGGLADIVADGETGRLVNPGNAGELCQVIERLLQNPTLQRQLGQAGRQRVERFRARRVVPQIEQVYSELLGTASQTQTQGGQAGYGETR
jgi:glycosyltransferase involved in cell wall biosynthesis